MDVIIIVNTFILIISRRASEIVIPEVKHSIFLLLLEYIYTDEVDFSLDDAMDLFQVIIRTLRVCLITGIA